MRLGGSSFPFEHGHHFGQRLPGAWYLPAHHQADQVCFLVDAAFFVVDSLRVAQGQSVVPGHDCFRLFHSVPNHKAIIPAAGFNIASR